MISYYGRSGESESYQFLYIANIQKRIIEGRKGLGTVFIAGAGNSKELKADTNYYSLKSNPYLIVVGGMDKVTDLSVGETPYKSFSTPGSNVLVSAPCYHIPTSALKLCNSFNSVFGNDSSLAEGTSYATPIISGITALMLQANPYLGLIDIQNILAYSAKLIPGVNFNYNQAKTFNGGGLHFSYAHGFGNVDATIAVRLAETWISQNVTFSQLNSNMLKEGSNILDFKTDINNADSPLNKVSSSQKEFLIDKIILKIKGDNIQLDKLNICISVVPVHIAANSFSVGTRFSAMMLVEKSTSEIEKDNFKLVKDDNFGMKIFMPSTNHFLGIRPNGLWEVNIDYNDPITDKTIFESINLSFYGRYSKDNTYVFTDESVQLFNDDRSIINCPEGINTINASAVSINSTVVSLKKFIAIHGNVYIIASESKIHNVFAGRDSMIVDNELDNILVGGSGSNTIICSTGHNIISGGKGIHNVLTSGKDADMFVIRKVPGSLTQIKDFKPNLPKEVINIVGFNKINSFAELDFEQQGKDLHIKLEDQTLVLSEMTRENIKEENFIFDNHFNFHAQFAGEHLEWNSSLEYAIYHP